MINERRDEMILIWTILQIPFTYPPSVTSLAGGGEEVVEVADMMDYKNRSGAVTHTSIPTNTQPQGQGTFGYSSAEF